VRKASALIAAILVAGTTIASYAGDSDGGFMLRGGYVHLGVSAARQADEGTLSVGGAPLAGAGYATDPTLAPSIEAGLVLRGGFGVSDFATGPMTTPNRGTGILWAYGDLGDETNAFFALTAHYHLPLSSWLTPYFGGGLGYMQALGTHDGVISNFQVNSAPGWVLQAGLDMRLRGNVGAFADVKRYFLSTTATGNLGPAAAVAQARVDPWIVSTGLTFTY
jgi:outer membrane protein